MQKQQVSVQRTQLIPLLPTTKLPQNQLLPVPQLLFENLSPTYPILNQNKIKKTLNLLQELEEELHFLKEPHWLFEMESESTSMECTNLPLPKINDLSQKKNPFLFSSIL